MIQGGQHTIHVEKVVVNQEKENLKNEEDKLLGDMDGDTSPKDDFSKLEDFLNSRDGLTDIDFPPETLMELSSPLSSLDDLFNVNLNIEDSEKIRKELEGKKQFSN